MRARVMREQQSASMKLIWPPKKTSPKFAHRVTRIRMLMKMISARNARRRRTRHSNPQSAFRNPKFSWARQDSNLGPRDYESPALTAELQARVTAKSATIRKFFFIFTVVFYGHCAK